MARLPRPRNPFYLLLALTGVVFCVSGWLYFVMAVKNAEPAGSTAPSGSGLLTLMERHGMVLLASELGVLALLTVAAMASDNYWTRRANARRAASTKQAGDE